MIVVTVVNAYVSSPYLIQKSTHDTDNEIIQRIKRSDTNSTNREINIELVLDNSTNHESTSTHEPEPDTCAAHSQAMVLHPERGCRHQHEAGYSNCTRRIGPQMTFASYESSSSCDNQLLDMSNYASMDVHQRSLCPWRYVINTDENRYFNQNSLLTLSTWVSSTDDSPKFTNFKKKNWNWNFHC